MIRFTLTFIGTLILHTVYSFLNYYKIYKQIIEFDLKTFFLIYLKQQDYFLGLSYAVLFAFMYYSFFKFKQGNKIAIKGIMGGGLFASLLAILSCFVLRICSGCLPVYCLSCPLSLGYAFVPATAGVLLLIIGSHILEIRKIYIFTLTLSFTIIGFYILNSKRGNSKKA